MQVSRRREIIHPFIHKLTFEKGMEGIHHKWEGDVNRDHVIECNGDEWITRDTFEGHIQDVTLVMRIKDGKIFNRNDQLLPYDLNVLGYGSTSLDAYVYTWEKPEIA